MRAHGATRQDSLQTSPQGRRFLIRPPLQRFTMPAGCNGQGGSDVEGVAPTLQEFGQAAHVIRRGYIEKAHGQRISVVETLQTGP